MDYKKANECECCWDYDNTHTKGKYNKFYGIVICTECLERTQAIEQIIKNKEKQKCKTK